MTLAGRGSSPPGLFRQAVLNQCTAKVRHPGLGAIMMSRSEFLSYNEREVARLRAVLARTTTPALKARLLETIENHERLARGEIEARELETIS